MGGMLEVKAAPKIDLAGLVPVPVTPFNLDGPIDYASIQRLGSWLGSIPGVKGLVKSVDNNIPIIAPILDDIYVRVLWRAGRI
jgi:hypothetical protein